ncbi:histidine kinase [[Empedobacter] haloabium]|uniref:Histidine kinase n=1 Tax=[Empedobacter] haloabium TaxID=592317 RepID=A0ABZ1UMW8_9BURK
MFTTSTLRRAWRSLWQLRARHDVSLAARLVLVSLLALTLALGLMSFAAVFGTIDRPGWWWPSLLPLIGICLCVLYGMFGTLWLAERLLPAALVDRMSALADVRAAAMLAALAGGGIVVGLATGFTVVPRLAGFDIGTLFRSVPVAIAKIALFLLLTMAANWSFWRFRLRRQQLRHEALDARLRLLQGQIEPHLLFNTLANVQSLMDHDPACAKRMLESFSDYLRASLSQLRATESTLGAELQTAQSYLALLQIRMEERLHFCIEASDEARAAPIPTLMLQPLVENAIHHGLEPKVDGGSILIAGRVRGGRLEVRVRDDGMGLAAPSRRVRPGAGMALANLRARLRTRYGAAASLTLHAGPAGGTEAVLELPLEPAA